MIIELQALEKAIRPYLNSLKKFQFSYLNPLFWVFFLFLFLILLRFWRPKKSFSFCMLLAMVLLIDTKIENFIGSISQPQDGVEPAMIFRIIAGIILAFISIYYFLIRED